jgi:hypothetical protein
LCGQLYVDVQQVDGNPACLSLMELEIVAR